MLQVVVVYSMLVYMYVCMFVYLQTYHEDTISIYFSVCYCLVSVLKSVRNRPPLTIQHENKHSRMESTSNISQIMHTTDNKRAILFWDTSAIVVPTLTSIVNMHLQRYISILIFVGGIQGQLTRPSQNKLVISMASVMKKAEL